MLVLLSPSKTMNEPHPVDAENSLAGFDEKRNLLVRKLARMSKKQLKNLLGCSDNLCELNYRRYKEYSPEHRAGENAMQAIFSYSGGVYQGLDAASFSPDDLAHAQSHLRILSAVYASLRPLDLVQPYRLEMQSELSIQRSGNLYEYWRDTITESLSRNLRKKNIEYILDLSSNEYSRAVDFEALPADRISVDFKEWRDGTLKFISFNAKKARGLMARYAMQNKVQNFRSLERFSLEGYGFDPERSEKNNLLFSRKP